MPSIICDSIRALITVLIPIDICYVYIIQQISQNYIDSSRRADWPIRSVGGIDMEQPKDIYTPPQVVRGLENKRCGDQNQGACKKHPAF